MGLFWVCIDVEKGSETWRIDVELGATLLASDSAGKMRVKYEALACKAQTHVNVLLKGLEADQHVGASFTLSQNG